MLHWTISCLTTLQTLRSSPKIIYVRNICRSLCAVAVSPASPTQIEACPSTSDCKKKNPKYEPPYLRLKPSNFKLILWLPIGWERWPRINARRIIHAHLGRPSSNLSISKAEHRQNWLRYLSRYEYLANHFSSHVTQYQCPKYVRSANPFDLHVLPLPYCELT